MKFKKHHDTEAKKDRNLKIFLAVFFSFLMIGSVLVAWVERGGGTGTSVESYKNLQVTQNTLGYLVKNSNGLEMQFDNLPNYVESINTSFSKFDSAIITFNPYDDKNFLPFYERAKVNMEMNLAKLQVPIGEAITKKVDNSSPYSKFMVADCSDKNLTVIYLVISNVTGVTQDGTCITVSGTSGPDLLSVKDAILLKYITK